MNDSVEQIVTEPSRVKKSKNRNKIIGGILAIATLSGGFYIAHRIHTKNEIYKLSSIKNNTDGSLGVYKISSVKNNIDGHIKYQYNVLAYRYEIYKNQYETLKNNIDKFSNTSTDVKDAKSFWDKYHTADVAFCDNLLDSQHEYLGKKWGSYHSDKLPFSPSETTYELELEVTKIMSEINNPVSCGSVYKEYVKTELLPKYKKKLDDAYDKMDKLHMKISNM